MMAQQNESKELIALKQRIANTPELSRFQSIFDDDDQDQIAMLLDNPKMLDMMIKMRKIWGDSNQQSTRDPMSQDEASEDENDPVVKMKKALKINTEYFKMNSATEIIKQTRSEFNHESESRGTIGVLVANSVKTLYGLELGPDVIAEIEVLSFNDAVVNLVHIDPDEFAHHIQEINTDDIHFVRNNLLENTTMDVRDCILTPFLKEKLFVNHCNITNINKQQSMWQNQNKEIKGGLKCGDIIYIENCCRCARFGHLWFIVDSDHVTLRRIGITEQGQYLQDPHIIIPGFVTQFMLDPIKTYSAMIHQHCFEDGGGILEIELQMDSDAIMFRGVGDDDGHHSLLNVMEEERAKRLVARYGWKQRKFKNRKNKHSVEEMQMDRYYTIYMTTGVGMGGALIGFCNHPDVHRVNLSAITDDGNGKYVIDRKVDSKTGQNLSEQQVNALLLELDASIEVNRVSQCLKRGIAFGVIGMEKGLDTVLVNAKCLCCSQKLSCTIRDTLYQPDCGGGDYQMECEYGALRCNNDECDADGWYVTRMCMGTPQISSGKYHNHCNECDGMGECQGDARNAHCYQCGEHYFAGSFGRFRCQMCYPEKNDRYEDPDEGIGGASFLWS